MSVEEKMLKELKATVETRTEKNCVRKSESTKKSPVEVLSLKGVEVLLEINVL